MSKKRKLLPLLLLGCIGMAQAQTTSVSEQGGAIGHEDQFFVGEQVQVTFGESKAIFTPTYYGSNTNADAAQTYTVSETDTPVTFSNVVVEPVQVKNPTGMESKSTYNVGAFVSTYDLDFRQAVDYSGKSLHAYVATGNTDKAITLAIQDQIKAGDAFVVRADDKGWYCVPKATTAPSAYTNKFTGSATTRLSTSTYTNDIYALSTNGGFAKVNKTKVTEIPIRKAIYEWEGSGAGTSSLALDFDAATAIDAVDGGLQTTGDGCGVVRKYIKGNRIVIIKDGKEYNIAGQQQ